MYVGEATTTTTFDTQPATAESRSESILGLQFATTTKHVLRFN